MAMLPSAGFQSQVPDVVRIHNICCVLTLLLTSVRHSLWGLGVFLFSKMEVNILSWPSPEDQLLDANETMYTLTSLEK